MDAPAFTISAHKRIIPTLQAMLSGWHLATHDHFIDYWNLEQILRVIIHQKLIVLLSWVFFNSLIIHFIVHVLYIPGQGGAKQPIGTLECIITICGHKL